MQTEFKSVSLVSIIKNLSTEEFLLAKCLLTNDFTIRGILQTQE